MAEFRETHVARDEEGRVIDTTVVVDRPKKGRGFGWGMLLGIVLIAGAIIAFAYTQGSFQQAGVEADQLAAQMEETTESAVEATGDTLQQAGAEQAANERSETATN